ncbi:hypothetical protein GX411_04305 [Candidatus Fermentibacteria bacterium]|nr:hypothetical protein [Candidatus Fermentibacteria bacterium]
MTILLVGRLLAVFLTGSLELTSWFTADTGTHFQYFRAVGLVLSGGNPVIVGCLEDEIPYDYNRLFTAREYDLDDPDDALWRCDYEDEAYGSLDDDGYAIVRYETEGDPPVGHFIAAGDTRVDLTGDPPVDDYAAGLILCLDADGDTECAPLVFRGTWYDAMSRGITYIGELGEESDAYAACGLYDTLDGSSFSFRGFVEIASATQR